MTETQASTYEEALAEAVRRALEADNAVAEAKAACLEAEAAGQAARREILNLMAPAGVTGQRVFVGNREVQVTVRAPAKRAEIHEPGDVPPEYCVVKPDAGAIAKAMRDGRVIPGARLAASAPTIALKVVH
jgi:hypothetical protein